MGLGEVAVLAVAHIHEGAVLDHPVQLAAVSHTFLGQGAFHEIGAEQGVHLHRAFLEDRGVHERIDRLQVGRVRRVVVLLLDLPEECLAGDIGPAIATDLALQFTFGLIVGGWRNEFQTLDDVPAEAGLERFAHLTVLGQPEGHILELLDHLTGTEHGQLTAFRVGTLILTVFQRGVLEGHLYRP